MKLKHIIFIIAFAFTIVIMPKANAQITRFQIFNYSNGTFTNTYDTNSLSGIIGGGFGIGGTNTRITLDDTLQINHNYTLTLTLTFESSPNSWFRWGQNAMSGVLIGSGYVVSSPSSGTTILNRYSGQYCIGGGPACWDFYRKQSTINFTFKPTSVSHTWSVNIPFDPTQFKYYSIDSYLLQDSGNSDSQAIINNQNINSQNEINAINNVNNGVNELNDTLKDDTVDTTQTDSFFADFDFYENSTFSSVITSPLEFINSIASNTCAPVNFTYRGKTITLPCGDTLFWGRSDVSTFRTFWNVLFGGFLIYKLAFKLFKVINDAIDPTKDDIGGVAV